jgi:lysophospholipase L1-like esterase
MSDIRIIASLGSSFAAGPGIEPIVDPLAMRSGRNYPNLLAEALGAKLVDLSVSGAMTTNIIDTPQLVPMGTMTVPPQIDGLPADADLVTITAGGNDIGFIASMLYTALARMSPDSQLLAMMAGYFSGDIPSPSEGLVNHVATALAGVVTAVRDRAPNARIILVDYQSVVAEYTSVPEFTPEEVEKFIALQAGLQQATAQAAELSGADLFAASALSANHALGAAEPWVFSFRPEMPLVASSFHPNAAGHQAVAAALQEYLSA